MAKVNNIYFLKRSDGLVKIGYSSRVQSRISELSGSHGDLEIIRIINGDRKREAQIHNLCRKHNEYGEWFRDSADLRKIIEEIDDGEVSVAETTAERKAWAEYEKQVLDQVIENSKQLVHIEYGANGNLRLEAVKTVSERYGIPYSPLYHILYGRARVVSAPLAEKIRVALQDSRQRRLDALLADIAADTAAMPDLDAELGFSTEIKALQDKLASIRETLSAA